MMARRFLYEMFLAESRQFRGLSGVRFDDLVSIVIAAFGLDTKQEARAMLRPTGGALDCNLEYSPKVWKDWVPSADAALAKAATDSARRSSQYPGEPRGGTVMKRNYGGRVVYQPGRRDQSHEQLPSAMDTYDVLMQGDGVTMTRFAYSPSQGSFEERASRLEDLMKGAQALPLRRRPQPEQPKPCPYPDCTLPAGHKGPHQTNPAPQPVPRVGQNLKKPRDGE